VINKAQLTPPTQLTLLSRSWCHLCDDMLAALKPLQEEFEFGVSVIDIDERPELEAQYGEWVPVLLADSVELCHYHLDSAAVRAYLLDLR